MRSPRAPRSKTARPAKGGRRSFLASGGADRLLKLAGNRATGRALGASSSAGGSPGGLRVLSADGAPEKSADRAAHAALYGRGGGAGLVGGSVGRSIQRLSGGGGRGAPVAPHVDRRLRQRAGTGKALGGSTRKELEKGFGVDLGAVRVHTDAEAGRLTRGLGAKALTVGRDVYFAPGQYNPRSRRGKEVLAHEVSHTIQQSGLRGGGRGRRAKLGTPSAPAVQRLIDADLFLEAVGDAKAHDKAERRRFDKVVASLREYHNTTSGKDVDRARRNALLKLKERCDKHWRLYRDNTPLAEWVFELGSDVSVELGTYGPDWGSTKLAGIEHEQKLKALTKDDSVQYAVRITAWITHSHYSTFAKTRARLVAQNKMNPFSSKESSELKTEAAIDTVSKYVDIKKDKKRFEKEVNALLTADVGHTWVSLERYKKDDGKLVDQKPYGFWPAERAHPTKEVDGDVRFPDNAHKNDQPQRSKVWNVPFSAYETALKEAEKWRKSPPKYKMVVNNCTTFARDIAQKAGVDVPDAYWTVPIKGGSVWNPNDMFDAFEETSI